MCLCLVCDAMSVFFFVFLHVSCELVRQLSIFMSGCTGCCYCLSQLCWFFDLNALYSGQYVYAISTTAGSYTRDSRVAVSGCAKALSIAITHCVESGGGFKSTPTTTSFRKFVSF